VWLVTRVWKWRKVERKWMKKGAHSVYARRIPDIRCSVVYKLENGERNFYVTSS